MLCFNQNVQTFSKLINVLQTKIVCKKNNINFVIFVDKRLIVTKKDSEHIEFINVNKFLRLFIDFYLFFKLRFQNKLLQIYKVIFS